jgi:hypothetical protein
MTNPPLIHLALERGSFTCTRYCAYYWRHLRDRTTVQLYETALQRTAWPRGVYLFTCTDGMEPAQMVLAKSLYTALAERPTECTVLNEPRRVLGRYELLKSLRSKGINDFDVFRLSEIPLDVRLPVFVRYERFHRANLTGLIHSRAELDDTLARLLLRGERAEELLVVEWLDYKDSDGNYRKWGAQKIGPHVFGKHLMAGPHWMVKRKSTTTDAVGVDEMPYVSKFPHNEVLAPVWEVSGHEWARIDYSFYRGRLQVWEINDNPEMGTKWKRDFGRRHVQRTVFANFDRAFDDVARGLQPGPDMELRLTSQDVLGAVREQGPERHTDPDKQP